VGDAREREIVELVHELRLQRNAGGLKYTASFPWGWRSGRALPGGLELERARHLAKASLSASTAS